MNNKLNDIKQELLDRVNILANRDKNDEEIDDAVSILNDMLNFCVDNNISILANSLRELDVNNTQVIFDKNNSVLDFNRCTYPIDLDNFNPYEY